MFITIKKTYSANFDFMKYNVTLIGYYKFATYQFKCLNVASENKGVNIKPIDI